MFLPNYFCSFVNYFAEIMPGNIVKIIRVSSVILFVCLSFVAKSQFTMTNNGATFYCANGSVVWSNGGVNNIGDSLYNLGEFTIVGNFQNDGLVSGNGSYRIGAHWKNNGTFKCGTSIVYMDNTPGIMGGLVPNQLIDGTSHNTFYDLTLVGVGVKSITLDDTVKHYLDLTDRELAVDNHTLFITDTDPLAIHRTSGFISNLSNGWLNRTTAVNSAYLFPMGSSFNFMRYRPVEITTVVEDSISQYVVGFFNYNPSGDGYNVHQKDTTICMVDSLYYHKINRVFGKDKVDITIYYDQITDGPWNGMANWNLNNNNEWINMKPTQQLYSPMWGIEKLNWHTWTNLPYALIARVPDSVQIDGPTHYCMGSGLTTYIAYGQPTDQYIWSVSGGHIVGDVTTQTIQILWDTPGTGVITVQEISPWGYCIGLMSHYYTTVYAQPIADFQPLHLDSAHTAIFAFDVIHFIDLSTNAVQWNWEFGDGSPSSLQSPYHLYDKPDSFNVCLTVASIHGCVADTCKTVDVVEGIVVPNVFTPNGDGYNDFFDIDASGMTDYHLQVFNRWGVLLFESNSPYVKWDGKTLSGVDASDGTYFYILYAKSNKQDYSRHGTVTLLRNK